MRTLNSTLRILLNPRKNNRWQCASSMAQNILRSSSNRRRACTPPDKKMTRIEKMNISTDYIHRLHQHFIQPCLLRIQRTFLFSRDAWSQYPSTRPLPFKTRIVDAKLSLCSEIVRVRGEGQEKETETASLQSFCSGVKSSVKSSATRRAQRRNLECILLLARSCWK